MSWSEAPSGANLKPTVSFTISHPTSLSNLYVRPGCICILDLVAKIGSLPRKVSEVNKSGTLIGAYETIISSPFPADRRR